MASYVEEEVWKCPKHPSKRRRNGICPVCLRDRLAGLCPLCAKVRPCACLASTTSSSSSSSSFSRVIDGGDASRSSFHRSRSVAIPFLRARPSAELAPSNSNSPLKKTPSFLSILRKGGKSKRFDQEVERNGDSAENFDTHNRIDDFAKMVTRSRSVSAGTAAEGFRRANADSSPAKGKSWHFPSPLSVFRSPKAPKAVDRSPLHR